VKLTVVGCAGSYPPAQSPSSCYLLEHDGYRIVLDMGSGALGALQGYVDPRDLSAIVLSHCHVDHCVDVASLFVLRHYAPVPSGRPLPLLGPSDTRARLAGIYGMTDPSDLSAEFDIRMLVPDPAVIGPFTITTVRSAHPVEAYCVRVEAGGRSVTYSGDTGPAADLAGLARGTDIALFEASFVGDAGPPDLHLTASDAGRIATEAGAGMLLLTHHVGWNDEAVVLAEATAAFGGPIEQARPGLTVSL
jgi:ribonuclease BN (tRNA processing enzyme)